MSRYTNVSRAVPAPALPFTPGAADESTLTRDTAMDLPVAMLMDLDDTIVSYSTYAGPCWQRVCHDAAGR